MVSTCAEQCMYMARSVRSNTLPAKDTLDSRNTHASKQTRYIVLCYVTSSKCAEHACMVMARSVKEHIVPVKEEIGLYMHNHKHKQ